MSVQTEKQVLGSGICFNYYKENHETLAVRLGNALLQRGEALTGRKPTVAISPVF